jgi:hypothetical protein
MANPELTLAGGVMHYYRLGRRAYADNSCSMLHDQWWRRVIAYYCRVKDNGLFYALMRTAQVQECELENKMGGDWFVVASLASRGKAMIVPEVSLHRELGGTSASYRGILKTLGLPQYQATFPHAFIAANAWMHMLTRAGAYASRGMVPRVVVGTIVFCVIVFRSWKYWAWEVRKLLGHLRPSAQQR